MSAGRRWGKARVEDLPPSAKAGDPSYWAEWTDDAEYGRRWHGIGQAFGLRSFGVNGNVSDRGRDLVVRHDENDYGRQEELYVLVRGRARFTCDGEEFEVEPGDVVYAAADVVRHAVALEDDTLVVMIGGVPGKPYEPDWDS